MTSSEEKSATCVPVLGVPAQNPTDHWVVVCSIELELAKMHSVRLILIGNAVAARVYEAASHSVSEKPAWTTNDPPLKFASVLEAIMLQLSRGPAPPPSAAPCGDTRMVSTRSR